MRLDVFTLIVIASIVIGVLLVGKIIRSKTAGKVEFHSRKAIRGLLWAFLGILVGLGLGFFFAVLAILQISTD